MDTDARHPPQTVGGVTSVAVCGGSALVLVCGNPTGPHVRAMAERIATLQHAGVPVIVEVTGLTVCSAHLLEMLVRARRRAVALGIPLTVAEPGSAGSPLVRNLLELVGLTGTLLPGPEG